MAKERIIFEVLMENGQLLTNSKKSSSSIDGMGQSAEKSSKSMRRLRMAALAVAGAVVAVGVAIGRMVSNQLEAIDNEAKLAQQYGVSVKAITELNHIAGLTGSSMQQLGRAMEELELNMGRAEEGVGKTNEAMAELGLNIAEIKEMEPQEAFYEVAEALQQVEDRTEQARIANDVFGSSGRRIIGVIRSSGSELRNMANEVEHLGVVLTETQVQNIEDLNDTMFRISQRSEGLKRQFTADLAPALNDLADAFLNASQEGGALDTIMNNIRIVVENLIRGIIRLIDVIEDLDDLLPGGLSQGLGILSSGKDDEQRINETIQQIEELENRLENLRENPPLFGNAVGRTEEELKDLYEKLEELQDKQEQRSRRGDTGSDDTGILPGGTGDGAGDAGDEIDLYQVRLDRLNTFLYSSSELREQARQEDIKNANEALDQKLIEEEEHQKAVLEINKHYNELANQALQESIAKRMDAYNQMAAGIMGLTSSLGEIFMMSEQAKTQNLNNEIQHRRNLLNEYYEKEYEDIENSLMNDEWKALMKKHTDEERAREERELRDQEEREKIKIERDAAKRQKKLKIFETTVATPQAAFEAYRSAQVLPWPASQVVGASMASMAMALGAKKLMMIKQQPLPQYAKGSWSLPQDQVAQVHKGEMIIPKPFAEEIRENVSGREKGSGGITIFVEGSVIDTQNLLEIVDDAQEHRASNMGATKYKLQSAYRG